MNRSLLSLLTAVLLAGTAQAEQPAPAAAPDAAQLKRMTARFAPVDLKVDVSKLPENEQRALAKMIQAAKLMDALFLRQVWAGNETLLLDLVKDTSPLGRERLHAFLLNKGPWSRLDHDQPFIPGVPAKPEGGNFYPAGSSKEDIERWVKALPDAQQRQATGFYTTLRRGPDGKLIVVPYSVEYQGELSEAAVLLREAAALTQQPTLKAFLDCPRGRLPLQRLLRQRRGVDGAGRQRRADHRALRGLRGRLVQLQGRLRGLHHPAR